MYPANSFVSISTLRLAQVASIKVWVASCTIVWIALCALLDLGHSAPTLSGPHDERKITKPPICEPSSQTVT